MKPGIYWIGVNDRPPTSLRGSWPITSEGISYNSYVVKGGEKNAPIDMAKDIKSNALIDQIAEVVDPADLDYIVINHMEPDHTGVLRGIRRIAPKATPCAPGALRRCWPTITRLPRACTSSVKGRRSTWAPTLKFVMAPMVHWPETMVTYETTQQVLFPCDAFVGYGALQGAVFDDQCRALPYYEEQALRQYANIVRCR